MCARVRERPRSRDQRTARGVLIVVALRPAARACAPVCVRPGLSVEATPRRGARGAWRSRRRVKSWRRSQPPQLPQPRAGHCSSSYRCQATRSTCSQPCPRPMCRLRERHCLAHARRRAGAVLTSSKRHTIPVSVSESHNMATSTRVDPASVRSSSCSVCAGSVSNAPTSGRTSRDVKPRYSAARSSSDSTRWPTCWKRPRSASSRRARRSASTAMPTALSAKLTFARCWRRRSPRLRTCPRQSLRYSSRSSSGAWAPRAGWGCCVCVCACARVRDGNGHEGCDHTGACWGTGVGTHARLSAVPSTSDPSVAPCAPPWPAGPVGALRGRPAAMRGTHVAAMLHTCTDEFVWWRHCCWCRRWAKCVCGSCTHGGV